MTKKITLAAFATLQAASLWAYSPVLEDSTKKAPKDWFHTDQKNSKMFGVSTEKAYELLKGRISQTVVVAVIDSGIDIFHEDLKDIIWKNPKEVAGNGIDDDKNGYIDDIYGWNFIGGKDGKHVAQDTYELTRMYQLLSKKYEGKSQDEAADKAEYQKYTTIKELYESKKSEAQMEAMGFMMFYGNYQRFERLMKAYLDTDSLSEDQLKEIESQDETIAKAQEVLLGMYQKGISPKQLQEYSEYLTKKVKFHYNLDFDSRQIVGDDYANLSEKFYGNNDVKGPDPDHGTHVAGIIAASRKNSLGIKGIADNVQIMVIRAVPDGDERDKDVANAIYYAVDNGAKIINMSFGKAYSPNQELVEKAIRYAEEKGVLLVHAAGNDAKNTEKEPNYPTPFYSTKAKASNWVEVGASSWKEGEKLPAEFSNYGKTSVDLFAPGVDIYSTTPENNYANHNGTSMAAPVVAGVAAMVLSYFPHLNAVQLKDILMKSSIKLNKQSVQMPSEDAEDAKKVTFGELSVTGGVVNAVEAVKMAQKIKITKKK